MSCSKLSDEDLIRLCAASREVEPWEAFIDRFHPVIAATIYRSLQRYGTVSTAMHEDLVQEMYTKLYDEKKNVLGRFEPRFPGSPQAFLRAITVNMVSDHFRTRMNNAAITSTDALVDAAAPPAATGTSSSIEREVLIGQVDAILRASGGSTIDRDRRIFWFHFRDGMSAREIAELPGIDLSIKGVESALNRVTRLVATKVASDGKGGGQLKTREDYRTAESL